MAKPKERISIRMYDVGFGDCFLVTIPTAKGNRRILFDCGSVARGTKDLDSVVKAVIADVTGPQGPRIDVVVCTHRHRDHIAGFSRKEWADVDVGEVWMPWTESDEEDAIRIREAQMRLATALDADLGRRVLLAANPAERERYTLARELTLNATGDANAMTTLHEGFKGRGDIPRRFLPEKDKDGKVLDTLTTDLLPGVTVHVFGPSRDESVIRGMDPPAGKSYMQLASSSEGSEAPDPFSRDWWAPRAFKVSQADKDHISQYSDGFPAAVAASLDSAVNGTSLMLLLQFRDTYLLFPGDAQWGTWDAAMENKKFYELLRRVRFYKVGHHGSHNATPIRFVEETIGKDVVSMASTRPMKNWPLIPMPDLMKNLAAHGPIVRSDQTAGAADVFLVGDGIIDTFVPV
jgi:beta-lactamase superfamily II metal-dependent hydrolase